LSYSQLNWDVTLGLLYISFLQMKILCAKSLSSLWKAREKLVLTGKTARNRKDRLKHLWKMRHQTWRKNGLFSTQRD